MELSSLAGQKLGA